MSDSSKRWRLGKLVAVAGALMAMIGSVSLWMAPDEVVFGIAVAGALLCLVAALMPASDPDPSGVSSLAPQSAPPRSAPTPEAQPLARRPVGAEREVNELKKEIDRLKALEQELLMAKQLAEAATMAKGEFLATMSHEIRTPLNGIIPLLDLLLGSQLGPDQREYVQTAFGSAKQLLRIVDDILDYSKLEANKLELETTGINLREVLQGVQKLMEKPAESKGLQVNLQIDPSVRLAVRGDSVRLRQILTNLVSNAVKFTDRGEIVIAVSKRGETRTQHDLRFEVRDTGIGITQDSAEKLFKPFSQADASTTRTFGGTGLGLVICKRIVDLMGGQIGVESELGKGSTFWFQVPMLKAVGDIGAAKNNGLQGARVLVLSNDASLMRRLSTVLPQWGATPVPATSSQEAFNKLRAGVNRAGNWAFQLLVVDLPAVKTTAQALHKNLEREPGMDQLKECWLLGDDPLPDSIRTGTRAMSAPRSVSDPDLKQLLTRFLEEAPIDHVAQAEPEIKVSGPTPSDEKLSGHVLLVEDNPVNRQVASRLLTLSGLSLDAAENGKEAVDLLASGQYACVLMDCQMPVMDGYTATRKWREQEFVQHRERMPIVAMTANAMVGDREKCLEAGMDDYITKPLNRGLLEQMLRKWLAQSPHKIPTRAPAAEPPPKAAAPAPRAKPVVSEAPTPTVRAVPTGPAGPAPRPVAAPRAQTAVPAPTPARPAPGQVAPARPTAPAVAQPVTRPVAPPQPVAPARPAVPAQRPAASAVPSPSATTSGTARAVPRPVAAPQGPAINPEIVHDLREIMGSEFSSLVNVFLEDAPRSLARLAASAATQDIDALVGPAHSLKSTSANLGAMELSAMAKHIEHSARQHNLPDAVQRVTALANEFKRAETALRGMIG